MKQSPKVIQKSTLKFAFQRQNYVLLIAGLGILLLGYLLMSGGASADPTVFNEDIFSFRRITLAPIVVLIGYAVVVVAIMYKPRKKNVV